jgi:hypothetical protein
MIYWSCLIKLQFIFLLFPTNLKGNTEPLIAFVFISSLSVLGNFKVPELVSPPPRQRERIKRNNIFSPSSRSNRVDVSFGRLKCSSTKPSNPEAPGYRRKALTMKSSSRKPFDLMHISFLSQFYSDQLYL